MKILERRVSTTGRRVHIMLFGKKIASYNMKNDADVHGIGNVVQIPKNSKINVHIYGDNNKVIVEETIHCPNFSICIGLGDVAANNCTVHIGKNLSAGGGFVRICEDNTICEIGEDCMFSSEISLWASDTHTMLQNGKCSNIGKHIKIGNHVWLGYGATILKNTTIANNSVIGAHSVVGGKFEEPGSVIAGNPGRVVRTGINWDRRRPKQYIEQAIQEKD